MKKNLLYLFAVLCSLSFFTSCGDDNDEKPNHSGVYAGDKLAVTLSGTALVGREISIDNTTATLKKIVPGELELAIPVEFTGDAFKGTIKNDAREVKVEGSVKDGKVNAAVTLAYTNVLAGNTYYANATSVGAEFETPKETITFMGDPTYKAVYFPSLISTMGGAMLSQYLQSVTFNADGTITASYKKGESWETSPKGYAFYNVVDGKVFVSVDIATIMANKQSRADANPLAGLMEMLMNGLPLGFVANGNTASFVVTREMMVPFMSVLPILAPMINNELVTLLAGEMPAIVNDCTKFNLTLTLAKK